MHLRETFRGPSLHPELQWRNPPPDFALTEHGLTLETAAETDFWQRTHYGFRVDNGHHLALPTTLDFILTTKVVSKPQHQYDQAGLMVWVSSECWLKAAVEFEAPAEPSRLGAVATNHGYSDWSTQDVPPNYGAAWLRIERRGQDFTVFAGIGDPALERAAHLSQIRLAHLHTGNDEVSAGLYACSPKAAGFTATFAWLEFDA